jgi:hypothetical protein
VELLLLHLATAGLRRGSGGVGQCGHLCPIRVGSRSILLLFDIRPSSWVAKSVVLSEEQRRCTISHVHGSCPVPQPKWGYGVAQQYIRRLQLLRDVFRRLLRGGLTGAPMNLRQPPHPTTPMMGDDNVDVSGAKLPRPFLLHRVR